MISQIVKRPILHVHVPKTAGQTFGHRVANLLPPCNSWHNKGDITGENASQVLDGAISNNVFFVSAHISGDALVSEERFDLLALVRNPVDQIISNLAHVAREPMNVLHALTQRMSPIEVIEAVPEWFFNVQARYLVTALTPRSDADRLLPEDRWLLSNLPSAVDRLKWLAPTENLDEFFRIFVAETGLSQPSGMASRNRAPNRSEGKWQEVTQWLHSNAHRYSVDTALYSEAKRRFDEYREGFWRQAADGTKCLTAPAQRAAIVHSSRNGEIKLAGGWTVREQSEQLGSVYQTGPTRDSYINLSDVSGKYLSFKIVFVAGISVDEIDFFDAVSGSQLRRTIVSQDNGMHLLIDLPHDCRQLSILVRAARAIPLCIYNSDWINSRAPVPFAVSSWSICNSVKVETEPGEHR
jgi:hypothetical protein